MNFACAHCGARRHVLGLPRGRQPADRVPPPPPAGREPVADSWAYCSPECRSSGPASRYWAPPRQQRRRVGHPTGRRAILIAR